jgi:hypothetical protein
LAGVSGCLVPSRLLSTAWLLLLLRDRTPPGASCECAPALSALGLRVAREPAQGKGDKGAGGPHLTLDAGTSPRGDGGAPERSMAATPAAGSSVRRNLGTFAPFATSGGGVFRWCARYTVHGHFTAHTQGLFVFTSIIINMSGLAWMGSTTVWCKRGIGAAR